MKFLNCIWLLLAIWSNLASAQVNASQDRLEKILKGVMRSEIALTQLVHEQFWSELRKFPANQQADFVRMTSSAMLDAHAYQIEVWESALLSFNKQKVFKSGKMSQLEKGMRSRILGTLPPNLSDETMRASIEAFDIKYKNSIYNANLVLEAAAKHQALHLPGQGNIEMSEASIQAISKSLKETFRRIQKLLNPNWTEDSVGELEIRNSSKDEANGSVVASTDRARLDSADGVASAPIENSRKSDMLNEKTAPPATADHESAAKEKSAKERYDELVNQAIQANVMRPTPRSTFQSSLEIAAFETQTRAAITPTAFEQFGAAVSSATISRFISNVHDWILGEKFKPVEGYKPDLKVLPSYADSELIKNYANATSPEAATKILINAEVDEMRRTTLMDRGKIQGLAMRIGVELVFWLTLVLLIIKGFSLLNRPSR